MISIDLDQAKNIWRNNLRLLRVSALEKLDIQFMRAIENNDIVKQQEIASKKQILRDAPSDSRIEQARSTQELININPIKELGF